VHDQAGQRGGDAVALGALLALLRRADSAFDRAQATYRIRRHEERAAAACHAETEEERRGGSVTFYRDTLGFEVRNDVGYGGMRWITVGPTDQPGTSISGLPVRL
jgi:hypothetical protein